jgi:hypothetical protein
VEVTGDEGYEANKLEHQLFSISIHSVSGEEGFLSEVLRHK